MTFHSSESNYPLHKCKIIFASVTAPITLSGLQMSLLILTYRIIFYYNQIFSNSGKVKYKNNWTVVYSFGLGVVDFDLEAKLILGRRQKTFSRRK